mgnify:FL=1
MAGVLALLLLMFSARIIQPSILELIGSYGGDFRFSPVPIAFPLAVLALAVLLGVAGAWFAAGHHLRQTRPVDL